MADELPESPYTELHRLPMPTIQEVDGDKLMCTTAKGWQKVMLMANDYQGLFMWRLKIEGALGAHNDIVAAYELKISSYEATIKVLQADRDYRTTRIGELETALLIGNKSFKIEKGLMWGVILVETVAIGALGIASFTQAN
jgi:hypothetical protein